MNTSRLRQSWIPWFLLGIGVLIAGLWTVLLASGSVSELAAGDEEIRFHLVAEFGTALILITSGILALGGHLIGWQLAGVGLGALLYTTINSAGYYAERDEWAIVAMFVGLTTVSVVAATRWLRTRDPGESDWPRSAELHQAKADRGPDDERRPQ